MKKTTKRLAYHYNKPGFWKRIIKDHLRRVSNKINHNDWLILDLSDIQKKYAKMMEGLAFVKDGNSDKVGLGYWLLNIIGYNRGSSDIVPLYNKLYSFEKGTMSENQEIIQAIDMVMLHIKKSVAWMLDRGADRAILIDYFINMGYDFIIRLTKKRKLWCNGQELSIPMMAKKVKLRYSAMVEKTRKNKVIKRKYYFGAKRVQYRSQDGKMHDVWCMVSKGEGRCYSWCLTAKEFESIYEAAHWIFEGYGKRWKIEEYHRHIKQQYKLESIQIRTFNGLQSMMSIITIAMHFIYREIACLHMRIILDSRIKTMLKRVFREFTNFIYYKISTLVAELLSGCTFRDVFYTKKDKPPGYGMLRFQFDE